MVVSQYSSNFSKSINGTYYWFQKVLCKKAQERMKEFLQDDLNFKLVGISEKDNIFFVGEEYFVTRIMINKNNFVFLRVSAALIDIILSNAIGKTSYPFSTDKITEMEAKILTGMNDFIVKGLLPFLSKEENENVEPNTNLAHMTLLVKNHDGNTGRLVLSVPINLLPEVRSATTKQNFDMDSFPKYKVPVKIITGKSEITLYDVQHIEKGDIVVLEQSNIKKMILDICGNLKEFTLNPETSIITGIDNEEGESMDNTNSSATMWDTIPVEISAEFEKVTISLGELKQISEGSIVDVGAIYENKIFLKVENKPIASGELIIINDKYAVRVDEVFTEGEKTSKPAAQQQQPGPVPPPEPLVQSQNDEEFNYDNFDIEDEDI